ncbi:8-hydroxygeraniol oxidoreductase-like [Aristolochia californica]|uniref:8-hydroxygeraniol oxidoreductase-like n=1 Tax=Aristolochia californica TaxID=171875 RepID=UPI0035D64CC0
MGLLVSAAVCWGAGEPMVIEEIEVEPPKQSEVRVKVLCASLCHTDVLFGKGFPLPLFPRVLGHEGVGVVESVGEGVKEFQEGDLVLPTFIGECGACENCLSEETNFCLKHSPSFSGLMEDGTSRMSVKGQKLYHTFSCSTWSEYTVASINYLVKVDPLVDLPQASILSCGFSTGYGSAWKVAQVEKDSIIAIFGLGAVGLGVMEAARSKGASRIIGIDLLEEKKEGAAAYGITDFINPRDGDKPVAEQIKEMTGGIGVDYSFDCTASPAVPNQALDCTKPGKGVTILIGVATDNVNLSLLPFLSGKILRGTLFGGIKPRSDLHVIVSKCLNKELDLEPLITHRIELEDISRAHELLKDPRCVKIVIRIA